MSRDTFYTTKHRGEHIHACFDRSLGHEVVTTTVTGDQDFKSVRDAKRAINKLIKPEAWTYRGIDVYPADRNSSGIRWYARTDSGNLRSDTKQSMRILINELRS